MKKNYFTSFVSMLFALLLFTGCQKSITESSEEIFSKPPEANTSNQCQLTHMHVDGFDNRFHYNSKGLADEWRIDYGDGVPDVYTMTYDNKNRLSRAWYHYEGTLIATIDFVWIKNQLTEEHWNYQGFLFDALNTYNKKGEMVKREFSDGWSGASLYSSNGNILRTEIFFNGELLRRGDYTFNQPNKNPFLAIQGIPYGFPFILFDFSKWWETSEKITLFNNGVPDVILDEDPALTTMQFGYRNYPTEVIHFDRVSNGPVPYTFEYQNCGPENKASKKISSSSALASKNFNKSKSRNISMLKVGPTEQIKKQLEQMRKK